MDNKNIVEIEETNAIEAAEDFAETNGIGVKIIIGAAVVGLVGVLAYRFAVKPIVEKIRNRKEANNVIECEAFEDENLEEAK